MEHVLQHHKRLKILRIAYTFVPVRAIIELSKWFMFIYYIMLWYWVLNLRFKMLLRVCVFEIMFWSCGLNYNLRFQLSIMSVILPLQLRLGLGHWFHVCLFNFEIVLCMRVGVSSWSFALHVLGNASPRFCCPMFFQSCLKPNIEELFDMSFWNFASKLWLNIVLWEFVLELCLNLCIRVVS